MPDVPEVPDVPDVPEVPDVPTEYPEPEPITWTSSNEEVNVTKNPLLLTDW